MTRRLLACGPGHVWGQLPDDLAAAVDTLTFVLRGDDAYRPFEECLG